VLLALSRTLGGRIFCPDAHVLKEYDSTLAAARLNTGLEHVARRQYSRQLLAW